MSSPANQVDLIEIYVLLGLLSSRGLSKMIIAPYTKLMHLFLQKSRYSGAH